MRIKYCEALKLNYAPKIELREIYGLLVYLLLIKQVIHQKYCRNKSEAVTQWSSLKIMFCKTSQILQESIWDGDTF